MPDAHINTLMPQNWGSISIVVPVICFAYQVCIHLDFFDYVNLNEWKTGTKTLKKFLKDFHLM